MPTDRHHHEAPAHFLQAARDLGRFATWRYAKTYARRLPHWYSLARDAHRDGLGSAHHRVFLLVRDWGYDRPFFRGTTRSADVDGVRFWHMGGADLINAVPIADRGDPAPVCLIHREETLAADDSIGWRQWRCVRCDLLIRAS